MHVFVHVDSNKAGISFLINPNPLLFHCLHYSYRQPQFKSVNPSGVSQGDGNLSIYNVTNYVISGITYLGCVWC